ncbi:MAG: WYL domain-containing protein [Deltaproteobacteria bacterium]|nr:WYL domain-containing protein [Deltaproteobacteria bacterium]
MRNEVRIFALDRIKMLHQTKDTFVIPEDFNLEEFIGPSFGVFQGEGQSLVRFGRCRIHKGEDLA